MGIQGLLPFLKKIHSQTNISQYSGCTVAIDAYCWLHRGAFSCADKLAMGEKTDQYVYYCMKYVNFLLSKNIKPIMVFDGQHLPSKREVEKSRRERREINRKKAAQFLREGKRTEARDCFQKCVDISPEMALALMEACHSKSVDCIVAPYEADAQLAYLNKAGIAQLIITEDSDLLLFGCDKVMFKMDLFGNGVLIDTHRLNEVMDMRAGYTFEKFRQMCILSGCDYLASLPGIGLAKSCKVFKTARQPDLRLVLKKIPSYLNTKISVSEEYVDGFIKAENTFLYQLVYDPQRRKLSPLNPYPTEVSPQDVKYAGPYISEDKAYQIAIGNWNIYADEMMGNFDPDIQKANHQKLKNRQFFSIWDKNYQPVGKFSALREVQANTTNSRPSTAGKETVIDVKVLKHLPTKRNRDEEEKEERKAEVEMVDTYGERTPLKKRKFEIEDDLSEADSDKDEKHTTPQKSEKHHLWEVMQKEDKKNTEKSPSFTSPRRNKFAVSPGSKKKERFNLNAAIQPPVSTKTEVKSRFFKSQPKLSLSKAFSEGPSANNPKNNNAERKIKIEDETDLLDSTPSNSLDVKGDMLSSTSCAIPSNSSPSAFSWSKFKFSKQSEKASGGSGSTDATKSKICSQFKRVAPVTEQLIIKGGGESEQPSPKSENLVAEIEDNSAANQNFFANVSQKSDSEKSDYFSGVFDSQGSGDDNKGSNSHCKFDLGPCSIETMDLTDSNQDSCYDSWRSSKFASQNDITESLTPEVIQLKESLKVSQPASTTPSRSSTSCRISGLSKNKGKNSAKTMSTSSDKQASIKNMFAKFAHKSKSASRIQPSHSDDHLSLTPVTSLPYCTSHGNISRQILP